MNMDRTTIIGFIILAMLFFGYFYFNNKEQAEYKRQQVIKDSIQLALQPKPDTAKLRADSIHTDSISRIEKAGQFVQATTGQEQVTVVENDLIKIGFTTKGGQPKWVELKKFKNQDSSPVRLATGTADKISYTINTGNNKSSESADMFFRASQPVQDSKGSQSISFTLAGNDSASGQHIVHTYTLHPGQYMVDFAINFTGADKLLTQNTLNLTWAYTANQQEPNLSFEKQNTQIGFMENGDFDYYSVTKSRDISFNKSVKWLAVRQRFFNTILIAKNSFDNGKLAWTVPSSTDKELLHSVANMQVKLPAAPVASVPFNIYYGPADFNILKKYDGDLDKMINLGQGIYAFVRPINKYIILPIWNMMKGLVSSYGLVIALLTLIIRLLTSPLVYKSYLSGAKMKALRPEIATLKEKFGGDQQQMSMEQMKLFREAGVNPMGGCIPALLQIPIFFALYSLFSSTVDLRGVPFWWANDLSAYDQVIKFGMSIPLLGNHISLFTITAVITSLFISLYSMSMTPDQGNPMMKYMPYIFPVFMLFIFNNLPSALTWYYTVSNIITLVLQFIIQHYIIDHDKIVAQLAANRAKPKTKSKWQERLEQMQQQQKNVQASNKTNKK